MSVQIFLQGKVIGIPEFLRSPEGGRGDAEASLLGRCHWIALLSEVLPRALLAELGLSKILLGSSGGGQFLVVLPSEAREQADAFLGGAAAQIHGVSGGLLKLVWAATENLGDWNVVRKRLNEAMQRQRGAPAADLGPEAFQPAPPAETPAGDGYFSSQLGARLREAQSVGWSPDSPGLVLPDEGKHSWSLKSPADGVTLVRHAALDDDGAMVAGGDTLAARAKGRRLWGVLRGDVDNFEIRIRRAQSIEEHVQLSVMYKQFFAGELEVLCSMPEFWRKVTVLYSGGDDFAVYGSWDALIQLAREIHRLFQRFTDQNLKDFPGPEGKTITMAVALAPAPDSSLASVFHEAGCRLEAAKSADKDCIHVLGHTLEWRQLAHAGDLKDALARLVSEFGCPPRVLDDLSNVHPTGSAQRRPGSHPVRPDRPWRYYRRFNLILGASRDRDFQKLRTNLIAELIGKNTAQARLRPASRVALEWARLLTEA